LLCIETNETLEPRSKHGFFRTVAPPRDLQPGTRSSHLPREDARARLFNLWSPILLRFSCCVARLDKQNDRLRDGGLCSQLRRLSGRAQPCSVPVSAVRHEADEADQHKCQTSGLTELSKDRVAFSFVQWKAGGQAMNHGASKTMLSAAEIWREILTGQEPVEAISLKV
jgi:hypothetical protein